MEPSVMEPPRPRLPFPEPPAVRTPVVAPREIPADVRKAPSTLEQPKPRLVHEGAKKPDFRKASFFEFERGVVWAWIQGIRIRTEWRNLIEIQLAFNQVILLKVGRNILLNPEAVLAITPGFGGRSKVQVAGNLELEVGRAATQRLKELLGI
jgi:hypothetical protein